MISGNPVETGTIYDLVLMCAAKSPQPWWASYGEWSTACWIQNEVQKRYALPPGWPAGCPAKVPPSPSAVAADVAGLAQPLVLGTVPGSVIETAALQYAQMLYPLAQVNYQVQVGTCAALKPAPVPAPVPGPGPSPVPQPQPGPGPGPGTAQPGLPPAPPPSFSASTALWIGGLALAGAILWKKVLRR